MANDDVDRRRDRRTLHGDVGEPSRVSSYISAVTIDFFAILMPGFVFVSASLIVLTAPFLYLAINLDGPASIGLPENGALIPYLQLLSLWFFIFMLVSSYVFGFMFFRNEPKKPDIKSIDRLSKEGKYKKEGMAREITINNKALGARDKREIIQSGKEYPYSHLYEYLADRDLQHLLGYVTWKGEEFATDDKQQGRRTKNFINIIKFRVEAMSPQLAARLIRNEAHIRLMSSMWYVFNSLWSVSFIGAVIAVVTFLLFPAAETGPAWEHLWDDGVMSFAPSASAENARLTLHLAVALAAPLLFLFISFRGRRGIERFLHYQRMREIVFVLEAAHICRQTLPESGLFEPPNLFNREPPGQAAHA